MLININLEGTFLFIIEEVIVGAFDLVLWKFLNTDIQDAIATGFSNTVPVLIILYLFILLIPVIYHIKDLK
jgi:hypothetical protein